MYSCFFIVQTTPLPLLNRLKRKTEQSVETRLKKPAQFQLVFKQNDYRAGGRCFLVLARENGLPLSRIGFAISKRWLPRAVDRNLARRIVREAFRHHEISVGGVDLVILGREGIRRMERGELRSETENLFARIVGKQQNSCPND